MHEVSAAFRAQTNICNVTSLAHRGKTLKKSSFLSTIHHHHLPLHHHSGVVVIRADPGSLILYQAVRSSLKIASLSCCVGFYDDSRHVIIHVAFHNCAMPLDWSTPWLLSKGKFSVFVRLCFFFLRHREKEKERDRGGR